MQNFVRFHQIVPNILSGNEIDNNQVHNYVVYMRKLTCNNPNVDLVNVNAYAKFGLIPLIRERKKMFMTIKGHNSGVNLQNLTRNNPN